MLTKEFQHFIRDTGAYETPADSSCSRMDRFFGKFDAWFYLKLFRIVYVCSKVVKRGEFNSESWSDLSFAVMRNIEQCGGKVRVEDYQNAVCATHPVVYVANHMSMVETMVLPVLLLPFDHITTVVKESLMRYPVFGTVMRGVNPVIVGRQNPRDDLKNVLEKGSDFIRNGQSVIIYPQSTRSIVFDSSHFNSIGIKLAKKTDVPIVPIALKTDFMGIGKFMRDFGPLDRSKMVCFKFGEQIRVSGNGKAQHQRIIDFIDDTLKIWSGY
ncbi:MAG: 1-acyl-sn-glycerol-3-phosphate acyltransferase [Lentisphaerae bacterium]|nr:1-acyl-sn-glycerol-3-phosphate acyltransferase [Lentisphaerota bacterium]